METVLNIKKPKTPRNRYWEIDFLRGVCILLMVMDHFFYAAWGFLPDVWRSLDITFWQGLSNFAYRYWHWEFRQSFRIFIIILFCSLCGISCTLSKSNLKRGLTAAIVAGLITLVTYLGERVTGMRMTIYFGVIHMYAAAILIYCVLDAFSLLIGGREYLIKRKKAFFLNLFKIAKTNINIGQIEEGTKIEIDEKGIKVRLMDKEDDIEVSVGENGIYVRASDQEDDIVVNIGANGIYVKDDKEEISVVDCQPSSVSIREWAAKLFPAVIGLILVVLFFSLWGRIENGDIISTIDRTFEGRHTINFMSMLVYLNQRGGLIAADYFPILPWAGFVFLGSAAGHLLYGSGARGWLGARIAGIFGQEVNRCFAKTKTVVNKSIGLAGRKTLWIYIVHQPLFVGFFWLMGMIYS
ncbi:MAG: heparan-alpha-glucosaminide N-acetyltransferase domain-containing protein [Firmicutes bacterium]|nr:heparan-alpha-glucosaminide N-acetyltransferase domain-containing protein [Bacillota bacterium]